MLQKLVIKNYAIIDKLEIVPDAHFNTITGETGAGKSIMLGALSLILGERADTSVLINKEEKCIVEAIFDISGDIGFQTILKEQDIDNEPVCIIRREINSSGKSRAFINDTPVTLDILSKFTALLVDLQQQFGHLALQEDSFQVDVIDAIAQNNELRKIYEDAFDSYKRKSAQLAACKNEQTLLQQQADYKRFLLDELEGANFSDNEIEEAERQLKQLANAEKILAALQASRMQLTEGEEPLLTVIKRIIQQLQSIGEVMPGAELQKDRLTSVWAELKDISSEIEELERKVNLDEGLMQRMQERLDQGYKLLKKHAVNNTADLLSIYAGLKSDILAGSTLDDTIVVLEKELAELAADVSDIAKKLSKKRQDVIPEFVKKVNELLVLVGMPNARFNLIIDTVNNPNRFGIDTISFVLDANNNGQFLPIYKVASGGEMSRIILCIKSLTAKAMHMPTLIFDEVDTGISGEAARQVGLLLRNLSQYHQVICITHQPQVAARGTTHFYVYKEAGVAGKINTKIKILQDKERVEAIARMIGGESPSNSAIANANELITMQ